MNYLTLSTLALSLAFLLPRAVAQTETQKQEQAPSTNVQTNAQTDAQPSALEDAIEDADADPRALEAIDLYAKGDVEGAYEKFKQIYDSNPDSDPPGVLLALLHSHAGNFLAMRRALEQTAEDYPSDPEAYLQLAGVDIQEGRFLEAQLLIERAEKLNDSYKENHPTTVSRLNYLKGEALTSRANLAERKGRYEEAKALTKKAIELNPENAQSYWNLGYLSMKLREYEDAENAYDKAAELNEELWPGWLQVATALDREDLVDEGKAILKKSAEKIKKASKDQQAQLARLYLRWNMIDDAKTIVDGFVQENNERDLERWLLGGWIALYGDKYAIAEKYFRNATLVDPESFEASNGLALALLDQRNKEKLLRAKQIAAKNYHAYPDNSEAAVTYAWTLFLAGNPKEANEIFGPILSSGKMTATVAYYLAEIANARGDQEMANTLLRLAISQKSNFPKRNAALELQALLESAEKEPRNPLDDFDENVFEEHDEFGVDADLEEDLKRQEEKKDK